jgi:hypothetical protein
MYELVKSGSVMTKKEEDVLKTTREINTFKKITFPPVMNHEMMYKTLTRDRFEKIKVDPFW